MACNLLERKGAYHRVPFSIRLSNFVQESRFSKGREYHIQPGYHWYCYQASARVSLFVLRAPGHLVFELFLEMGQKFLEIEAYQTRSAIDIQHPVEG